MSDAFRPACSHPGRRAFTLVEALLSMLLVSVAGVAALSAVAMARKSAASAQELRVARALADDLMAEVTSQRFRHEDGIVTLGLDAGESVDANKPRVVNDIDDFAGLKMSPVTNAQGVALSDASWSASIAVDFMEPGKPAIVAATPTTLKRVTVTITHSGRPVATVRSLRSLGGDQIRGVATP